MDPATVYVAAAAGLTPPSSRLPPGSIDHPAPRSSSSPASGGSLPRLRARIDARRSRVHEIAGSSPHNYSDTKASLSDSHLVSVRQQLWSATAPSPAEASRTSTEGRGDAVTVRLHALAKTAAVSSSTGASSYQAPQEPVSQAAASSSVTVALDGPADRTGRVRTRSLSQPPPSTAIAHRLQQPSGSSAGASLPATTAPPLNSADQSVLGGGIPTMTASSAMAGAAASAIAPFPPAIAGYSSVNHMGKEVFKGTTILPETHDEVPTTAPGSPFELALQSGAGVGGAAKLPPTAGALSRLRGLRPHKPKVFKRLEQGEDEFRRRQAVKALGKIITKEHVQYQLSYAMMLGIYTSVVATATAAQQMQMQPSPSPVPGGRSASSLAAQPSHSGHTAAGLARGTGAGSSGGTGSSNQPGVSSGASVASGSVSVAGVDGVASSGGKLALDDFMKVRKVVFPPGGSPLTPPHPLSAAFKFKDYAPKAFHALRERFSIDQSDYLRSLGGAYEYIEFNSNSKSGSFFFYSHDGRFMIKTQTRAESKFLRRILAHYYSHVMTYPYSYITRFYGMHRLKMPHLRRKIHFVVMQSVFASPSGREVHEMYDLKGSSVGRSASEAERSRGPSRCVYKDNDLVASKCKIKLGTGRREAFLAQLSQDAQFLLRMGIMDYSLLLGIHYRSRQGAAEGHALVRHGGLPSASSAAQGEMVGYDGSGSCQPAASAAGAPLSEAPAGESTAAAAHSEGSASDAPAGTASARLGFPVHNGSSSGAVASVRLDYLAGGTSAVSVRGITGEDRRTGASLRWVGAASAAQAAMYGPALSSELADVPPLPPSRQVLPPLGLSVECSTSGRSSVEEGGGSSGTDDDDTPLGQEDGGVRRTPSRQKGRSLSPMYLMSRASTVAIGAHGVLVSGLPPGATQPPPGANGSAGKGGVAGVEPDGTPADEVYFLGIIDILQQFDLRKLGENVAKSLVHSSREISAVSPEFYAQRFLRFINEHTV